MKNINQIAFLLLISISCYATSIPYQQCAPAKIHLLEVNKLWTKHFERCHLDLSFDIAFDDEDERIQFHLEHVEDLLRDCTKESNGDKRDYLLSSLSQYATTQIFPKNTGHQNRQPYFVDHQGTLCAVGHLLHMDGQQAMIDFVKSKNNFDYILDMDIPELTQWADQNGFTVEELALIQPAYPSIPHQWSTVGSNLGFEGSVNIMKADNNDQLLYLAGSFSSMDGVAANNIIAYDSTTWYPLGNGVDGVIYDMTFDQNENLYVAGQFALNNIPNVNIARWDGVEWKALTLGQMDGPIYAVQYLDNNIYVGGDFSVLNNTNVSNLAYLDLITMEWQTGLSQNDISVDHVVRDLDIYLESLIVAGHFTQTASLSSSNSINKIQANYLAFWSDNNWSAAPFAPEHPIDHIEVNFSELYFAGDIKLPSTVGWMDLAFLDFIEYLNPEIDFTIAPRYDSLICGFLGQHIFGGFSMHVGDLQYSQNYGQLHESNNKGINQIDSTITAMAIFKNKIYTAGLFSSIENASLNGLARISGTSKTTEIEDKPLGWKLYFNRGQLNIEGEVTEPTNLLLYDVQGNLIVHHRLIQQKEMQSILNPNLPFGLYFYSIQTPSQRFSGRILKSD